MKRRRFPLFIVDASRAHGRPDTDYIYCTSAELPFIVEVTYISETQYQREYDRDNDKIIYSKLSGTSRARLEVVEICQGYDKTQLRGLLNRALKELELRRVMVAFENGEPTSQAVVAFADELIKQGMEQARKEPGNRIIQNSLAILNKIRKDYE